MESGESNASIKWWQVVWGYRKLVEEFTHELGGIYRVHAQVAIVKGSLWRVWPPKSARRKFGLCCQNPLASFQSYWNREVARWAMTKELPSCQRFLQFGRESKVRLLTESLVSSGLAISCERIKQTSPENQLNQNEGLYVVEAMITENFLCTFKSVSSTLISTILFE